MTRFSHLPDGYEDQDTRDRKKSEGSLKFTIPGQLPTQNKMIGASNRNRHAYNQKKKEAEDIIKFYAQQEGVPFFEKAQVTLHFYREDRRTDPDNIVYAVKLILDALEDIGVVAGDGWKQIKPPFVFFWHLDKENPRTVVKLTDYENSSLHQYLKEEE